MFYENLEQEKILRGRRMDGWHLPNEKYSSHLRRYIEWIFKAGNLPHPTEKEAFADKHSWILLLRNIFRFLLRAYFYVSILRSRCTFRMHYIKLCIWKLCFNPNKLKPDWNSCNAEVLIEKRFLKLWTRLYNPFSLKRLARSWLPELFLWQKAFSYLFL